VEISVPVPAFTALLAIVTTVLVGLLPAWKASTIDPHKALKTAGRGIGLDKATDRVTKALIVAEIALSLVLVVGAALLSESVMRFAAAPLGFEPRGLMTMAMSLPSNRYATGAQRVRFFGRVPDDIGALGSVQGFAASTVLPLRSGRGSHVLSIEGRPEPSVGNAVHDIGTHSRLRPTISR
jgi:putative ABC transport system permease protein